MPSEMLSGPDLGAGFLHQLTTDRDGDRTSYTYHAQDGGADANGPPKGPLDVLGFVHPSFPCQFGGPRCWHRRFLLPFSETPRVRACYNRNRFVLQAMIDQAYEGAPADIEGSLAEVVARLRAPASGVSGSDWRVDGAAGAWVLGAPVAPREIDLGCVREAIDALGAALAEYLIEPVATTDRPPDRIVRGARAFVGSFSKGARVEWSVPIDRPGPVPGAEATVRSLSVPFRNGPLIVARPEYALVSIAPGDPATGDRLARWLGAFGADLELLDALLDRSALASRRRSELRARAARAVGTGERPDP
jgi:hypothetical protein